MRYFLLLLAVFVSTPPNGAVPSSTPAQAGFKVADVTPAQAGIRDVDVTLKSLKVISSPGAPFVSPGGAEYPRVGRTPGGREVGKRAYPQSKGQRGTELFRNGDERRKIRTVQQAVRRAVQPAEKQEEVNVKNAQQMVVARAALSEPEKQEVKEKRGHTHIRQQRLQSRSAHMVPSKFGNQACRRGLRWVAGQF
jgi:hypothetical protein